MTAPSAAQVQHYLSGIAAMARGDAQGLSQLDLSYRGFWQSFWAYAYALPAFGFLWFTDRHIYLETAENAEAGADYIFRAVLSDVVGIALSIGVIALLARPLGMSDRFGHWLISANWLSLPLAYLVALVLALVVIVSPPDGLVVITMILLQVALLVVSFRVYKAAFDGDGMLAFGVIAITFVIELMAALTLQ